MVFEDQLMKWLRKFLYFRTQSHQREKMEESSPMSVDLSKMSLEDLKQLEKDVAKAIKTFEARKKAEAVAAAEAAAKEHGFSLGELTGGGKTKQVSVPKFQHPENPQLTWTGRGRKPKWFEEALALGKTKEDLLIK